MPDISITSKNLNWRFRYHRGDRSFGLGQIDIRQIRIRGKDQLMNLYRIITYYYYSSLVASS